MENPRATQPLFRGAVLMQTLWVTVFSPCGICVVYLHRRHHADCE